VAIWHPIDSRPASCTDTQWHAQQMASLRDLAFRIEDLNRRIAALTGTDGAKECSGLLPARSVPHYRPRTLLQRIWVPVAKPKGLQAYEAPGKLQALAVLRRNTATINRNADARIKTLINRLLITAAAIVLLLQICEYWIPASIEQQNLTSSIGAIRAGLFVVAVALLALSWIIIVRARKGRYDERQNDYRAIAEALRVQFFWNACGSGESVDQRYLQRQKNELSWIRAVVSSVSSPVTKDREEFEALKDTLKLDRLRRIQRGWIGEQQTYFQRVTFELGKRKHWLHFFANIFLVAGVLMIFVGIAAHLLSWEHTIERMAHTWGVFALPQVLAGLITCFLLNELIAWKARQHGSEASGDSSGQPPSDTSKGLWNTLLQYSEKISHGPWTVIALGCLIGVSSVSAVFGYSWDFVWFPTAAKLNTIPNSFSLAHAKLMN